MKRGKLICAICGKGSAYKVDRPESTCNCCGKATEERVHRDDRHRVGKSLCVRCYKREMRLQMRDEIGGFLGNREYHGDNNLVAMAKAIVADGWAKHYGASEYQVFKALKAIQEGEVLDIPDGVVETLER